MSIKKKPLRFSILVVLLFLIVLAHLLFLKFECYFYIEWLDMPMHSLGGFLLGLTGIYFLSFCFNARQTMPIILIVTASLFTAFVFGCIWELIEFNSEAMLGFQLAETKDIKDTVSDLFFDCLGALSGVVYFLFTRKNHS